MTYKIDLCVVWNTFRHAEYFKWRPDYRNWNLIWISFFSPGNYKCKWLLLILFRS
jgi:hypothetical protein